MRSVAPRSRQRALQSEYVCVRLGHAGATASCSTQLQGARRTRPSSFGLRPGQACREHHVDSRSDRVHGRVRCRQEVRHARRVQIVRDHEPVEAEVVPEHARDDAWRARGWEPVAERGVDRGADSTIFNPSAIVRPYGTRSASSWARVARMIVGALSVFVSA